ncbi:MAG TPA: 6-phosphogluconolactonase [Candidatus Binataceae bacterium]|jgi:6-phosphogluconolactonase
MGKPKLTVIDDKPALATRAAEEIVHAAGEAICTLGEFTVCLTGGTTVGDVYSLMADRFRLSVDWKAVRFFWGDERCVAPTSPDSNYQLANRTMLSKLAIKPSQIHRIRGEDPPAAAASGYENELREAFSLGADEFPRFDLVLLGVGDNAHIASLFPRHPAIHEAKRLAVAVEVDAPQRDRISLTAPVFNNAALVMLIVSGASKAQAIKKIFENPRNPDEYPAQLIDPSNGEVMWLVDKAAASLLKSS